MQSQPSHRKRLKTAENKGFLTFLNAMGRSVPLKTPIRFQIANKINGFVHVSYGTALKQLCLLPALILVLGLLLTGRATAQPVTTLHTFPVSVSGINSDGAKPLAARFYRAILCMGRRILAAPMAKARGSPSTPDRKSTRL